MEGSGRCLIEEISWSFPGMTDEKHGSQDSWCPGRDSSRRAPEYESKVFHRTTYDIFTLQHLRFLEVPNILNRWCLYMLRLDISGVVLKQRMRQSINQQLLCSFNHHQWHLYTFITLCTNTWLTRPLQANGIIPLHKVRPCHSRSSSVYNS